MLSVSHLTRDEVILAEMLTALHFGDLTMRMFFYIKHKRIQEKKCIALV